MTHLNEFVMLIAGLMSRLFLISPKLLLSMDLLYEPSQDIPVADSE